MIRNVWNLNNKNVWYFVEVFVSDIQLVSEIWDVINSRNEIRVKLMIHEFYRFRVITIFTIGLEFSN